MTSRRNGSQRHRKRPIAGAVDADRCATATALACVASCVIDSAMRSIRWRPITTSAAGDGTTCGAP